MSWRDVPFETVYAGPSRNGIYKPKTFHGRGCRIVNMGELFGNDFISNQEMNRVDLDDAELANNLLEDGDLLFGRRSLVESGAGKCSLVIEPQEPLVFESSIIRVRVVRDCVNPRFLFYYFRSPQGRGRIKSIVSGTNVKGIRGTDLRRLPVPHPPRREQDAIAETLTAYDDLIENNRRRMALLEEAARQLYLEWFVRLRFPGQEHTRIIDDLPEGWTRKSLSETAEFRLGKMLDQTKNKGDLMPYLANINVRWGGFDFRELREMRFEEDELETFGLEYGDIVMCEGGEPGRCAIWKEQMPGMMIQKAIHRIRARNDMHPIYLYHSLRHQGESGHLAPLFTGATIKHLPREKLEKVMVVVPPARLMHIFIDQAGPIESQLKLLDSMNRRACEARDLLLPRLMSGEIDV